MKIIPPASPISLFEILLPHFGKRWVMVYPQDMLDHAPIADNERPLVYCTEQEANRYRGIMLSSGYVLADKSEYVGGETYVWSGQS